MRDFWEDLGKRITETAETVTQKTEEVVEIQKIKSQIRLMKRNNDRDFKDMGKMIYESFQKGEISDFKYIELCEAIEKREESIEAYLKEIAQMKGMEICSNCKKELEPGMIYCPQCGAKVGGTTVTDVEEMEFEEELGEKE